MIVKTEAVVLKSMKYRESSKILSLYTREFGKISVIAKGARDRKSKFGSSLEPMNYVLAVIYKNEDRDLHLLSQCDLMKSYRRLTEDFERMSTAMAVLELINLIAHGEEQNEPLFKVLVDTLESINSATNSASNALYFIEMKLSEILGFKPNFLTCLKCSIPVSEDSGVSFGIDVHLALGGVLCKDCSRSSGGDVRLSAPALNYLQRLQDSTTAKDIAETILLPQIKIEVGNLLRRYLQRHVENLHTLKSERVFAAIM